MDDNPYAASQVELSRQSKRRAPKAPFHFGLLVVVPFATALIGAMLAPPAGTSTGLIWLINGLIFGLVADAIYCMIYLFRK